MPAGARNLPTITFEIDPNVDWGRPTTSHRSSSSRPPIASPLVERLHRRHCERRLGRHGPGVRRDSLRHRRLASAASPSYRHMLDDGGDPALIAIGRRSPRAGTTPSKVPSTACGSTAPSSTSRRPASSSTRPSTKAAPRGRVRRGPSPLAGEARLHDPEAARRRFPPRPPATGLHSEPRSPACVVGFDASGRAPSRGKLCPDWHAAPGGGRGVSTHGPPQSFESHLEAINWACHLAKAEGEELVIHAVNWVRARNPGIKRPETGGVTTHDAQSSGRAAHLSGLCQLTVMDPTQPTSPSRPGRHEGAPRGAGWTDVSV